MRVLMKMHSSFSISFSFGIPVAAIVEMKIGFETFLFLYA